MHVLKEVYHRKVIEGGRKDIVMRQTGTMVEEREAMPLKEKQSKKCCAGMAKGAKSHSSIRKVRKPLQNANEGQSTQAFMSACMILNSTGSHNTRQRAHMEMREGDGRVKMVKEISHTTISR